MIYSSYSYEEAIFCSIDGLYARQYNIPPEVITQKIPMLTFAGENPLLSFVTPPQATSEGLM